jgi:hypothetical protein
VAFGPRHARSHSVSVQSRLPALVHASPACTPSMYPWGTASFTDTAFTAVFPGSRCGDHELPSSTRTSDASNWSTQNVSTGITPSGTLPPPAPPSFAPRWEEPRSSDRRARFRTACSTRCSQEPAQCPGLLRWLLMSAHADISIQDPATPTTVHGSGPPSCGLRASGGRGKSKNGILATRPGSGHVPDRELDDPVRTTPRRIPGPEGTGPVISSAHHTDRDAVQDARPAWCRRQNHRIPTGDAIDRPSDGGSDMAFERHR